MKRTILFLSLIAGLGLSGTLAQTGGAAGAGSGASRGTTTSGSASGGNTGNVGIPASDTGVSGGQLRPGQGVNTTGQGTFNTDTGADGGRIPPINSQNSLGARGGFNTGVSTGGVQTPQPAVGAMPRVTTPGLSVGVTPGGAVGVVPSAPPQVRPGWRAVPGTAQANNSGQFGMVTNQFGIGSNVMGIGNNPITPPEVLTPTSRTNGFERILQDQNNANPGVDQNQSVPGGIR